MFKHITNISGISSKLGNLARSARSKAVLTAAIAGLGLSSTSLAAVYPTITSISTHFTTGVPTSQSGVTAYGTTSISPFFPDTNTYTMNYANDVNSIVSATAGGTPYNVTGLGTVVVRRGSTGANNDTVWEDGAWSTGSSVVNLQGTNVGGTASTADNKILGGNNILEGADNVFSNMGNSVGNNTNIDRVDVLFTGGIKASTAAAFAVYDRGPTNDHDAFQIAAITGMSGGVPSSYGQLIPFTDGSWGTTNVVSSQQEIILRTNNSSGALDHNLHPSDSTGQPIGGVLIPSSNLVAAGTTIYGYSLFSATANGSGTQLVDWNNTTYFPAADSTSTGGGLDPLGVIGLEYQSAVPEPASVALLTLGIGGLMARRPKRNPI